MYGWIQDDTFVFCNNEANIVVISETLTVTLLIINGLKVKAMEINLSRANIGYGKLLIIKYS